jgi:hypothetical protein
MIWAGGGGERKGEEETTVGEGREEKKIFSLVIMTQTEPGLGLRKCSSHWTEGHASCGFPCVSVCTARRLTGMRSANGLSFLWPNFEGDPLHSAIRAAEASAGSKVPRVDRR